MKKSHVIIMATILVVLFFTFYYLENIEILLKNIPSPVYSKYLEVRHKYNCGIECFAEIDICTNDLKNMSFFMISGGYSGGGGNDIYFDINGKKLCDAFWSVDECKQGACADRYKDCPSIGSCEEIMCSTPCPIGTSGKCEYAICSS